MIWMPCGRPPRSEYPRGSSALVREARLIRALYRRTCMKLVVFNEGRPGVWTERGIVDVSKLVLPLGGHDGMRAIIERFDELEGWLNELAKSGAALPLNSVSLRAPLPRATILAMGGNYRENG